MQSVKIISVTRETAVECANGTFDTPIRDDTWERLLEHALNGSQLIGGEFFNTIGATATLRLAFVVSAFETGEIVLHDRDGRKGE